MVNRRKKLSRKLIFIYVLIFLLGIIGEVKCIVKAFKCDWDPIGKSEIVYTVGAATGLGSVIGWINIKE